jgi:hypothetical protein
LGWDAIRNAGHSRESGNPLPMLLNV